MLIINHPIVITNMINCQYIRQNIEISKVSTEININLNIDMRLKIVNIQTSKEVKFGIIIKEVVVILEKMAWNNSKTLVGLKINLKVEVIKMLINSMSMLMNRTHLLKIK